MTNDETKPGPPTEDGTWDVLTNSKSVQVVVHRDGKLWYADCGNLFSTSILCHRLHVPLVVPEPVKPVEFWRNQYADRWTVGCYDSPEKAKTMAGHDAIRTAVHFREVVEEPSPTVAWHADKPLRKLQMPHLVVVKPVNFIEPCVAAIARDGTAIVDLCGEDYVYHPTNYTILTAAECIKAGVEPIGG